MYRADIVIVPPLRAMLLISYWGRPKTISESVKRILPRMFYHLGIQGLPPLLIKIRVGTFVGITLQNSEQSFSNRDFVSCT